MKSSKIPYLFSEGVKGLYRNKILTATSIFVLTACMIVVGLFVILRDVIENNISKTEELYVITAYVNANASEEDALKAKETVEVMDNVKSVRYVSKADAIEELKGNSGDMSSVVDEYKDELSAYIRARFDIEFETYDKITALVYGLENVEVIETVNTKLDLYHGISSMKKAVTAISAGLGILLFIVAIFVTLNTVRIGIYYRRQEISLMRYMGATKGFITAPYIIECFFMGAVSVVIATGLEFLLYKYVVMEWVAEYGIGGLSSFSEFFPVILPALVIVGVLSSTISGIICIKKYLSA